MTNPVGGSIAIVTGGGSGLGRAVCLALAHHGLHVWAADLDLAAAENTIESARARTPLRAAAGNARHVDVTDRGAVESLISQVVAKDGRLDLMVNCAGRGFRGEALDASPRQWEQIVNINLWGVVHGTLAAYRQMARQRSGRILNVASLAGLLPVPGTVPYTMAKHGVVGFSRALRAEAARHGVIVQVACPGPFHSNFFASLLSPVANPGDRSGQPSERGAPAGAISADAAAQALLDGMRHDRAVIVFPQSARWKWRAAQFVPGYVERLQHRLARWLPRPRDD